MLKTGDFRPVGEEDEFSAATPFSMALFIIEREIVGRYQRYAVRYVRTPSPDVPLAAFAFSGKAQPQHGVHFVILICSTVRAPESFASRRIPGVQTALALRR